jgi:hypothetical protein
MGSHTKLEVSRLSHRGVAAQVYAVAACWLLPAVRLRNGRCFPPIGRLEMTLHGDFVLFDERHRNIGKVDHLRRYGAQKQTSQPTKAACPHHDLIGHGFARDAVNRLGGGRCLDVASRAQVMGQQFRLAFDEIGTSQRRNTEVPLTHRWRELDSKFRFGDTLARRLCERRRFPAQHRAHPQRRRPLARH